MQIIVANCSVTYTNPSAASCAEHVQRGLFTFQQVRKGCALCMRQHTCSAAAQIAVASKVELQRVYHLRRVLEENVEAAGL